MLTAACPPVALSVRMSSGTQEAVKWAALGLMVVDHAGVLLLSGDAYVVARVLGRLVLPLLAFLVAYNIVSRGVDPARYLPRLVVVGLVAQPVYAWAFGFPWWQVSIFGTLAAGVGLVAAFRSDGWHWRTLAVVAALVAVLAAEYGAPGVLLIPALVWWFRSASLPSLTGVVAALLLLNPYPVVMFVPLVALGLPAIVGRLRLEVRRSPAWVAYAFYPVHLVALRVVDLARGVV